MPKRIRPKTWWTLPTLSITPGKTFFGLGANGDHTFTIAKTIGVRDDSRLRKWMYPDSSQTRDIELIVLGSEKGKYKILEAQIRWSPTSGGERDLMLWTKFPETQEAIRKLFSESYHKLEDGIEGEITERAVFHHLGGSRFMLERRGIEDEGLGDIPTLNSKGG